MKFHQGPREASPGSTGPVVASRPPQLLEAGAPAVVLLRLRFEQLAGADAGVLHLGELGAPDGGDPLESGAAGTDLGDGRSHDGYAGGVGDHPAPGVAPRTPAAEGEPFQGSGGVEAVHDRQGQALEHGAGDVGLRVVQAQLPQASAHVGVQERGPLPAGER